MDDFYNTLHETKRQHWADIMILFCLGAGFGIMIALWFISSLRIGNQLPHTSLSGDTTTSLINN